MSTSALSFPYPVVGNENDVEGRFVISKFDRTTDPDKMRFDYGFEVTNQTIVDLIGESKAKFVIQVECTSTFYRKAFYSVDFQGSFEIGTNELREKVTIRFFVCANELIQDYLPVGSHPDYEDFGFEIEKGDVLAVGGSTSFIAEKTFDPLRAPVDSLFRIKPGSENQAETQPEFDLDKIVIVLPKKDYEYYVSVMQRQMNDNIHATLVFPVLVEAINIMKHSPSDYEHLTWFERINQISIDNSYDLEEPLLAAQKILSNPVGRSFKQLQDTLEAGEEGED